MMNRWVWFFICALLGAVMLVCGWLMPIHLRATDASVIARAGSTTPSLVERGLELASNQQLGAAQLLSQAAQAESLPNREKLQSAINSSAKQSPIAIALGAPSPHLESLPNLKLPNTGSEPFTEFVVRLENRNKVLELLRSSSNPLVQELLRCRALTNTVLFPPSSSASGQAFDAAISVTGLLSEEGRLTTSLRETLLTLATEANRGGNPQRLEEALLDLMSLGQRFNWSQLGAFVSHIEDANTLRLLANQVRKAGDQLPMLFSAVEISRQPSAVSKYLMNFSQTGLKDLGASLRFNAGGVNELLQRNQRLYHSDARSHLAQYNPFGAFFDFTTTYCWRMPWLAMAIKWFFYLAGGFLVSAAVYSMRPAVSALEQPLQVRGFHVARKILFALGFLLVVLVLSEPFLAQDSQKVELPFRLHLPMAGSVAPAGITQAHPSLMNPSLIIPLLLFFVIQGLIYIACLVKLAEIRRQNVPPRLKLRLLENEEHLFDAGLYLGFAGTIVSFILASLVVFKPGLMVAYSSTAFGIVFVSVFKIFHLRPARRKMLLAAEADAQAETVASTPARSFATTP
ncbi:MAG: hypothetical protein JWQ71_2798 [Pedosphaera sp.]|nr:hypothetical protein [Pedosphaera sp.]